MIARIVVALPLLRVLKPVPAAVEKVANAQRLRRIQGRNATVRTPPELAEFVKFYITCDGLLAIFMAARCSGCWRIASVVRFAEAYVTLNNCW